ncbi:MAG: carbohydrate binding domain-containing protein, partial [Opitutales bacterium]|nr:carbohydrate binding domain-containing protein [Opitutales bacterium]
MRKILIITLLFTMCTNVFAQVQWHYPLYLDRGEPAKKRVEVKLTNNSEKTLKERVLFLSAEKLGLVGQKSDSIRVLVQDRLECREVLFSISPYGKTIKKDTIITVPFSCEAKEQKSIFVYFDNKRANEVPDFYLFGLTNENFEQSTSETLRRYEKDVLVNADERHLTTVTSRTGKQSAYIKGKRNWTSYARAMQVNEGATYQFEGWVKVENLKSENNKIGYYLVLTYDTEERFYKLGGKLENPKKRILIQAKEISENCDWTKITANFTVPQGYNRLRIKTKSFAIADTYFDDIKITEVTPTPDFSYEIMPVEELNLTVQKAPRQWEVSSTEYDVRITVSYFNLTKETKENILGSMPIKRFTQGNFPTSDFKVFKDGKLVKFGIFGDNLILNIDKINPMSEIKYNIYLKSDRKNQTVKTSGTRQVSYIPSDQVAEVRNNLNFNDFVEIFNKNNNLLKNGSFEQDFAHWTFRRKISKQIVSIVEDETFGKKALRFKTDKENKTYPGIEQSVKIKPKTTYTAIIWGKKNGEYTQFNAPILRITQGKSLKNLVRKGASLVSNGDWEIQATTLTNPYNDAWATLIISNDKPTDFLFDNAFLCESISSTKFTYSTPADLLSNEQTDIWQVNTIVKVFPFFAQQKTAKAEISLAKNEYENLQLAVRSNKNLGELEISAPALKHKDDANVTLEVQEIGKVGLVAVDSMSKYSMFTHFKFYERCVPTESMLEFYPDPIIPTSKIKIKKNKTQSIYLSFKADEKTKSGIYEGVVELKKAEEVVASIPYQVTVRNFSIPDSPSLTAMFSFWNQSRVFGRWRKPSLEPGMTDRFYDKVYLQNYLKSKRLTLDTPFHPRTIKTEEGYKYDFTDFDRFCDIAFNKQGIKLMYLPLPIPMLNFARPLNDIKNYKGETVSPVEGKWPYHGKDLSKISPEYIQEIHARIKPIYNHIKEKGWQNRFIKFISDEPYYWRK